MIEEFHDWKSLPFVKDGKKDDDCERGMFRSYQIIASLIGYGASEIKKDGEAIIILIRKIHY